MSLPIKTLLFDFGGTLDADGTAWQERFYAYYKSVGLDMTPAMFASAFYAADNPLVGTLAHDADLTKTVRRLTDNLEIEIACRDSGMVNERPDLDRVQHVAALFLAEASAAFARNRPLLEALGARYQLGVVSNFYGNLEAVCQGADLSPLFAVIVDSYRVGAQKPDPAIFRAALDPLRATPETTLVVGDSLIRDRAGARRLGMGFVWIAPPSVQAAEAQASREPINHLAVARLVDLAEILM
jgi:HAD superfamily hydrolase (TIGR01509 family)